MYFHLFIIVVWQTFSQATCELRGKCVFSLLFAEANKERHGYSHLVVTYFCTTGPSSQGWGVLSLPDRSSQWHLYYLIKRKGSLAGLSEACLIPPPGISQSRKCCRVPVKCGRHLCVHYTEKVFDACINKNSVWISSLCRHREVGGKKLLHWDIWLNSTLNEPTFPLWDCLLQNKVKVKLQAAMNRPSLQLSEFCCVLGPEWRS